MRVACSRIKVTISVSGSGLAWRWSSTLEATMFPATRTRERWAVEFWWWSSASDAKSEVVRPSSSGCWLLPRPCAAAFSCLGREDIGMVFAMGWPERAFRFPTYGTNVQKWVTWLEIWTRIKTPNCSDQIMTSWRKDSTAAARYLQWLRRSSQWVLEAMIQG